MGAVKVLAWIFLGSLIMTFGLLFMLAAGVS